MKENTILTVFMGTRVFLHTLGLSEPLALPQRRGFAPNHHANNRPALHYRGSAVAHLHENEPPTSSGQEKRKENVSRFKKKIQYFDFKIKYGYFLI